MTDWIKRDVKDGEFVRVLPGRFYLHCCDCELVHIIEIKITRAGKAFIDMRFYRDDERTTVYREEHGVTLTHTPAKI